MTCFAKTLKELRNNQGLTQEALGTQLGLSKSSVNMYERGEREPSISTLMKMAKVFSVDMNTLLKYEE